jgi:hypothetical protein
MPTLAGVEYLVSIAGPVQAGLPGLPMSGNTALFFALDEMAIRFVIVAVPFFRFQMDEGVTLV